MAIRVVIFDYDGTVINSFLSASRISALAKKFCIMYMKWCYPLLEMLEIILHMQWPLHAAGMTCIEYMLDKNLLVGIATERSLAGLVVSARRSGMAIGALHFIRVRKSVLDAWVRYRLGTVFHAPSGKDGPRGFHTLIQWLHEHGVSPVEVLMVGDDDTDRRAAALHGFSFVMVDRHHPNFEPVYRLVAGATCDVPGA